MKNLFLVVAVALVFALPVKAVTSITQYNITWRFDKDVPSGQFCTGDYWVVGPVKIVGITNDLHPSGFTPDLGEDGTMVNPGTDGKQGYDSRLKSYDASLNAGLPGGKAVAADNPLEIKTDASVVSSVSWLVKDGTGEAGCPKINGGTKEPRPVTHAAAVLTVLTKAPPEGSFRPPYSGTDKTIKYNVSQLDLTKLKNIKPPASTPALEDIEKSVARPWIDHVNEYLGAMVHPTNNMPQYGRELCMATDDAAIMLNLDFSQLPGKPTKNKLAIGYAQMGIDFAGIADSGGYWPANGGHHPGRKLPILVAGYLLNDEHMKDVGKWKTRFQEDEQTFYIAQENVDVTHSANWKPDYRNKDKAPYEAADIGMPEWGIVHTENSGHDDKDWEAVYRKVNGPVYSAMAVAIHAMGLEEAWNHKALLDYAGRYIAKESLQPKGGALTDYQKAVAAELGSAMPAPDPKWAAPETVKAKAPKEPKEPKD